MLPGADVARTVAAAIRNAPEQQERLDLDQVAGAVIEQVSGSRATWTVYHVRAEAQRQLRPHRYTSAEQRLAAVEDLTRRALNQQSVLLDVERDQVPTQLQRPDGESVFRRRGAHRYTSETVLEAEQNLVDAAHDHAGPRVSKLVRELAIRRFETASGKRLNPGQKALVRHFVSSGAQLAVAIGPPGTGKSTAMRAVREAWETTGGHVIGFAPSAAAASVLGDELGVRADTLHSLIAKVDAGDDVDITPGDLVLVDEAGMAGTLILDRVLAIAAEHGAVVRLVGDYRQLTAVEAGGALRLIHHDAGGVELDEVHRFRRADEADAVLRFRVGDPAAVAFYETNQRLVGGVRPAVLDRLYRDWKHDLAAGRNAIMISDSNDVARELSARAQTERRAAGLAEDDGVTLHDGNIAGVGDRVVTRKNKRRLSVLGGRDYVKNGDLWQVTRRHRDGRLTVRHERHGGTTTLPAWYVTDYVQLGYAATIHRSQGLTVDISRSFLSPAATREAALVALSRGVHGNHAYLDTEQTLHPDEPELLPGDLFYRYREASDAAQALHRILAREGAELSATETLREALDERDRLDVVVPQYAYARQVHRGEDAVAEAQAWVRAAVPEHAEDVLADEAWPELHRVLREAVDAGADPVTLLRSRAHARALVNDRHDPAQSVAKVLHYRITENLPAPDPRDPHRPDQLPGWVPTPPDPTGDSGERDELAEWLHTQVRNIAQRVQLLGDQAAEQPPAWAAELGPVPRDRLDREQWVRRAGQVAAYRERFQVPNTQESLLPQAHGGEQERARSWLAQHLHDTRPVDPRPAKRPRTARGTEQRAADLRGRLAALHDRLVTNPHQPSVSGQDTTTRSEPNRDAGVDPD